MRTIVANGVYNCGFVAALWLWQASGNQPGIAECSAISAKDGHLAAVSRQCEFARSFRQKLPSFACDQIVSRSTTVGSTHGTLFAPISTIRAQETYLHDTEHYSSITVDGKSARTDMSEIVGLTSTENSEANS